ncbi:hypothetical protein K438DRAFT_1773963 [Mycena galopus ATCC 62051]|nr:hypothetical protein K438DRAFT_1773963 [Mycena galopus ATCC 62051]
MCCFLPPVTLASSILFGVLSLLPDTRWILLTLGLAGWGIHIANGQHPTNKLRRVEDRIKSVNETLKHANENCPRNYPELVLVTGRLFEEKLSVSKIKDRMLEPPSIRSVTTYEEFVQYLKCILEIMRDVIQCAKKVEGIRTSILVVHPREVVSPKGESLAVYPTLPCQSDSCVAWSTWNNLSLFDLNNVWQVDHVTSGSPMYHGVIESAHPGPSSPGSEVPSSSGKIIPSWIILIQFQVIPTQLLPDYLKKCI